MRRPLLLFPVELAVLAALTLVTIRADGWIGGSPLAGSSPDACADVAVPDPTVRVTGVEVTHDATAVHVRVRLDEVPPLGMLDTSVSLRTDAGGGQVQASYAGGAAQPDVLFFDLPDDGPVHARLDGQEPGECHAVTGVSIGRPCPARAELDAVGAAVEVSVPRSCLGDPAWVRVGASTSTVEGGVLATSHWEPAGSAPRTGLGPPYGPRVPLT